MATTDAMPEQPLLLIRGGHVYAPQNLGVQDILVAMGKIVAIGSKLDASASNLVRLVDAGGKLVMPGFIDGHVHILGGGGEGGPQFRTRDLLLSDVTRAGVTTVIGMLGTDSLTRNVESLVAKARALTIEGISAYALTGGYVVPPMTLTGSVARDIYFLDNVLGVGEIAISDHRSSQPTVADLAKVIAEARQGGLVSDKAGTVVIHVGGGPGGLQPIVDVLASTGIPPEQVLPTHINRSDEMLEAAAAYARQYGPIDVTAGMSPHLGFTGGVKPSQAIKRLLDAGVDPDRITMSTDGNGNMPVHDEHGNLIRQEIAQITTLYDETRDLVREDGVPIEVAIRPVTSSNALAFGLRGKGTLAPGKDADLLLTDPDFNVRDLYARGRLLLQDGMPVVRGIYERN